MWNWLTERRRKHILEHAFPAEWEATLARDVRFYGALDEAGKQRLRELAQVFVAEKNWEGCGGLELTDAMKVTIAAEACRLIMRRDHALFADVESILVYPSTVTRPERPAMVFERGGSVAGETPALLGEAHLHGPVILVWDAALRGARDPSDGRNVVIHEFAHKIDQLDGGADGTPPLPSRGALRAWAEALSGAFLALRSAVDHGEPHFLDGYGARNEAEFFAVASEAFFERGAAMAQALPDVYAQLAAFYNQDPAASEPARDASADLTDTR